MTFYSRKLKLPFDEVVQKMTQSLQRQGFGIITTINLMDVFKNKLDLGFRPYKILGACNPDFAYQAVSLESHLGLMLPCNVVIQQHENGDIEVSAISPLEMIDKKEVSHQLGKIATTVNDRLRIAVDDLHRATPEPDHDEALPIEREESDPRIVG
jgi:uncharacterized protein (DUF302 family)